MTHDCAQKGHIWIEADGTVMNRKRDLSNREPLYVHCKHCEAATVLTGWGEKRS